jgi:hypothetical protein
VKQADTMPTKIAHTFLLALLASAALSAQANAQVMSREQDIGGLRVGQRVMVDDGSCPAGQIKEVSGSTMTANGVVRVRKCIPRLGAKKR